MGGGRGGVCGKGRLLNKAAVALQALKAACDDIAVGDFLQEANRVSAKRQMRES